MEIRHKNTASVPGSKDRFAEFCRETYVPLHLQPWWLDAVCGAERWNVAVATDGRGHATGVLPYFLLRRWGLRVVQMPPYTTYAGPWLRYPDDGVWPAYRRISFEQQTVSALIEQMPRTAFWMQQFRPEVHCWLPFYWTGYRQTTRYTYVLPAPVGWAAFYAGLKDNMRTELRKAEEHATIGWEADAGLAYQLNRQSFARKGQRMPYSWEPLDRLHQALAARGQSAVLAARNRDSGAAMAALYLAFDHRQAAVLLTGLDPAFRHTGALHGLYAAAVRFCIDRGLSLDFEGSMQAGIERVFRAFGGQPTPYSRVWRAGNRWLDLLYRPSA